MNSFDEITLRLKPQLKTTEDKVVAKFLGFKPSAWVNRKKRDAFPEKELYALAAKRPDLNIDVQYVLTGKPASEHQAKVVRNMLAASEGDEELMNLAAEAAKNMSATGIKREQTYKDLLEILNGCSDKDLEMIVNMAIRLR